MAPIVLFAYNRPWHTEQTLRSLANNQLANECHLIAYIDGPKANATAEQKKKIDDVVSIVREQKWCKSLQLHISESNKGLANSLIHGVTHTLSRYDRVIVLEDDMILSPFFLQFMNDGLNKYQHEEDVISIHGYCVPIEYSMPIFFLRGADCWGWATWKRGWKYFNANTEQLLKHIVETNCQYDFDFYGNYPYVKMLEDQIKGKIDSWAIRWYASAYLQNKLTLYPGKSLVQNIGHDGSGTHQQSEIGSLADVTKSPIFISDIEIKESKESKALISRFYFKQLSARGKMKKWLKLG